MKVVILAGGLGTRLAEYTEVKPKPMVEIGGRPILWHIMNIYSHYGYNDFIIALGYKGDVIKEYFLNYYALNSNFTIDLSNGKLNFYNGTEKNWKATLVDTGLNSMTGGRVKRLENYLNDETFMLTYGDGVSNINISNLVEYHKKNKKLITLTAVHPKARYGELEIKNQIVTQFKEKPELHDSWINGGFMVVEPEFLKLIHGDETILEHEPLEQATQKGNLVAFQHDGFWQCMDTLRDMQYLNKLWESNTAPWKIW